MVFLNIKDQTLINLLAKWSRLYSRQQQNNQNKRKPEENAVDECMFFHKFQKRTMTVHTWVTYGKQPFGSLFNKVTGFQKVKKVTS